MIIARLALCAALLAVSLPVRAYETVLTDMQVQGTIQVSRLNEIFNQYLATVQLVDPEQATRYGLHDADRNLTPRTLKNEQTRLDAFRNYLAQIDALDPDVMPPDSAIDFKLFRAKLLIDIANIDQLQNLRRRPQYYMEAVASIYGLLSKDFEPYPIRAENALLRLEQLPAVLTEAEQNLYHPPKIWVDKAIDQCNDAEKSFPDLMTELRRLIGMDPLLRQRVEKAVENAKKAVTRYQEFLQDDVMVQADGDFRVGEEVFGYYLERWHMVDDSPGGIIKRMKKNFASASGDFMEEYEHYMETSGLSVSNFDDVLYKIGESHPAEDELEEYFRMELERAYKHFDKYRLLPLPRERLKIVPTPEYLKSQSAFAFYNAPFSLDKNRVAELFINLPSRKMPKNVREAVLRLAFSEPYIEMAVVQEAFPGRHLQDSQSLSGTRIRRLIPQPFIQNGWAAYAQYLALEQGYFTHHAARLVYLRWNMVRAARAMADAMLHNSEMDYNQAV
ncbi:MAG: DUF885 family protein, partial [Elusimicrobiaceae bacterium]|nr:DUF885 family protein [Elusimicrobiaceae bacterium]